MRRIYIASTWKNVQEVRLLAATLREEGHEVFDFTDTENRVPGIDHFNFDTVDWFGKPLDQIEYQEFLRSAPAQRAFKVDRDGLNWCDTVILILPCGRSAHLEAGYAVGQGKDLFIFGDLPLGEFETMYGFARACYRTWEKSWLLWFLKGTSTGDGIRGGAPDE